MRAGIVGLNEKRALEGKEGVTIGIGVSAGEAVAGTVGTADRMEYTVIGDSVNVASRFTNLAEPGQIIISENTLEKVKDVAAVEALPSTKIKGKEEAVPLYNVLGIRRS